MSQVPVHQLYRRLETIGKGAYGSVHKGVHIPTGDVVALKIINLDTSDDDVEVIQREVALLTQLRDAPNITQYFGCYMDGPRVWIVMELAQGGSVFSLMQASPDGCLEEKYIAVIIREVLVALNHLHKIPVIHRDIKAANILVTAVGKVMLCDFGVSALLATTTSKRNTLVGTGHWMAPEVVQTIAAYDTKADIWSLGIMIYEMIKGKPPHQDKSAIQVMEIIHKTKPPRLGESEGGKDMRDFMASCLREHPDERLSAEELSKTKWVKSISRVPLSILQDLIYRLQPRPRDSLAEPLDWEKDEQRARQEGNSDEKPWQFDDTIRGRPHMPPSFEDDDSSSFETDDDSILQPTLRPAASTPLPSSLRLLFGEETSTAQDTFRTPVFPSQSQRNTPSPPSSMTSSPARDAPRERKRSINNFSEDDHPADGQFMFPRTTRSRSKLAPSINTSDEEDVSRLPNASSDENESTFSFRSARSTQTYRDVRSARGPADIAIPGSPFVDNKSLILSSPDSSTMSASSPDISASATRPSLPRQRSRSDAEGMTSRPSARQPEPDLTSPAAFQFPVSQKSAAKTSPGLPSPDTTPGVHQPTYSLDTSSNVKRPPASPRFPASITRARSATALQVVQSPFPSTPSPSAQDAFALSDSDVLLPPVKPFAPTRRDRSGSDVSIRTTNLGTPGLKDVLKIPSLSSEHHLGMSDLLPPSPSAATMTPRVFAPSPSLLNSSTTNNNQHYFSAKDSTPSPSFILGLPRSTSPPPLENAAEFSSAPFHKRLHSHNPSSSFTSITLTSSTLPLIRPLDYTALITTESTQAELAHTIEDLTRLFSVVEKGLSGMLDTLTTTIEEEEDGDFLDMSEARSPTNSDANRRPFWAPA
ncbi:Pkinase-domain-containing protein [Mycena floridula]|nr:Pkinase-domain-containing protein [Mycena floridula]